MSRHPGAYPPEITCQAMNNFIQDGRCRHRGGWWIDDMRFCGVHRFQAEIKYGKEAVRRDDMLIGRDTGPAPDLVKRAREEAGGGAVRETWVKGEDRKLVLDYCGRDVYRIDGDLLRELLRGAGWTEKKREAGQ